MDWWLMLLLLPLVVDVDEESTVPGDDNELAVVFR